MKLADGDSLLFIGDSITDCGRTRPGDDGDGLGDGYVAFVDSLLAAWYPQYHIDVLNRGVSGDRVTDLAGRWQADVLALAPDWLSVMIGINDVWRQFDRLFDFRPVTPARYETTYRRLLEQTRPQIKGLVLMAPYYLQTDRGDAMRQRMDAYGLIVRQLAAEFDALFVDVQAAFDAYLARRPARSLCADRIHVNDTGHLIIARSFLTAIGFAWDRERATVS